MDFRVLWRRGFGQSIQPMKEDSSEPGFTGSKPGLEKKKSGTPLCVV